MENLSIPTGSIERLEADYLYLEGMYFQYQQVQLRDNQLRIALRLTAPTVPGLFYPACGPPRGRQTLPTGRQAGL